MFGHRNRNRRSALLASAALVGGALLMTACQDTDGSVDSGAAQSSSPSADAGSPSASASASASEDAASDAPTDAPTSGASDEPTASPSAGNGSGSNGSRVGQVCGANDLSWSTRSESQAGGYILVMAKAKSGITCVLPAALPTVAFGSDGTEAGPVEQAVGKQITLSKGTVAYAGVNPKTTNTDGGKELDSIIVAVGNEDPNPVSLKVGTITVDKPVVTNWHTAPKDAVPFN
ncbi:MULTISPECIES: DUF4232 domain-containing protein [unclassified Streptomyces]|uniref:DUF4232 domain-containing protein n=1 Tax=unclassified Streptomyces TaxID=2593676 RepID=UPI000978EF87|nr:MULTISPECIES: DUF4232 domain-containing protein [unclassified Streptomyces]ONI54833.1 hypothetical protein STIB_03980 [Streptomyces sp. IB2014 011-1]RDV52935.1 DUF4232 domain-containing protein [Streptomyces sp. IB2014 011-12]